jgi:hypothetical protein
MKHRSELISIYKAFVRMVHTQFSSAIRFFTPSGVICLQLFMSFSLLRVLSLSFLVLVPMLGMEL